MQDKTLLGVERSIQIFNKESHELKQEVDIDVSLEKLLNIIRPKEDDPNLYEFYKLDEKQISILLSYLNNSFNIDTINNYYVLACFGLYN